MKNRKYGEQEVRRTRSTENRKYGEQKVRRTESTENRKYGEQKVRRNDAEIRSSILFASDSSSINISRVIQPRITF
ncbi:hypothetical protein MSVAZ_2267 [Methanosarcina vacuolata Z-761]|uniref:Uncharacterized protein n=1 Tax=Methanosarcina vacuolata Z-761 TaxID=1434123 RepID=A0A0E3LHM6_9EURY|nr:hypothetical protein MSVAZ_2267 [Methanosarcina vacuolata Z-761]